MAMVNRTYSLCFNGTVVLSGSARKINEVYNLCVKLLSYCTFASSSSVPVLTVIVNM
ncbi:hypothetical protein [Dipodfec virus UOA04_Rod_850]|nr:hypothetical protein [Dipodfec virus UOA04_Rod_850]